MSTCNRLTCHCVVKVILVLTMMAIQTPRLCYCQTTSGGAGTLFDPYWREDVYSNGDMRYRLRGQAVPSDTDTTANGLRIVGKLFSQKSRDEIYLDSLGYLMYEHYEATQSEARIFDGMGDLLDSSFDLIMLYHDSIANVPGAYDEKIHKIKTQMSRNKFPSAGITNGNGSYKERRYATPLFLPPPLIPWDETLEFEFVYSNATPPGIWSFDFHQVKTPGATINYNKGGDFFTLGSIEPDPNQTGTSVGLGQVMQLKTANDHINDQRYHFVSVTNQWI